jgi:hypothetical protein
MTLFHTLRSYYYDDDDVSSNHLGRRKLAGTGLAQNAMDTRHDFLIGNFTMLMIAIVFCTLVFESIEHGIMHVAEMHKEIHGSIYHDVLIRIKNELMILGLLSFILVFLEESLELTDAELHTFHYAHLLVFMIAVTFAIQGGFIIFYTKRSRHRWRIAEHDVRMQIPQEIHKSDKLSPRSFHRRMQSWLRGEGWSDVEALSPASVSGEHNDSIDDASYTALDDHSASCLGRLREASHFVFTSNEVTRMIRFRVIRRMFASMYLESSDDSTGFASTGDSDRRADFDFSVYLTLSVQKNALELLDVRKTSWIAFSSVIGLNWIRYVIWIEYQQKESSSYNNNTTRRFLGVDSSEGVISDDNAWMFAFFLIGVGFFVLIIQLILLFVFEDTINTLIARHGTSLLIPNSKRMSKSSSLFRLLNILLVATMEKDRIDAARMSEQSSSTESKALKKHKKKSLTKILESKEEEDTNKKGPILSPLRVGDDVKVIKAGSQTGRMGHVLDPDWHSRVKIELHDTREIKSYLRKELELVRDETVVAAYVISVCVCVCVSLSQFLMYTIFHVQVRTRTKITYR